MSLWNIIRDKVTIADLYKHIDPGSTGDKAITYDTK
jgi:hypothetical protein